MHSFIDDGSFKQFIQAYKITRKVVAPDDHQLLLIKYSNKLYGIILTLLIQYI